jgi:hypothetical protein
MVTRPAAPTGHVPPCHALLDQWSRPDLLHVLPTTAGFLSVEKWEGVVWQQDRVTELRLNGRGLTGGLSGIAPILEQLPGLLVLSMSSNSITGPLTPLPSPSLRTLDLSLNQLTGTFSLQVCLASLVFEQPTSGLFEVCSRGVCVVTSASNACLPRLANTCSALPHGIPCPSCSAAMLTS